MTISSILVLPTCPWRHQQWAALTANVFDVRLAKHCSALDGVPVVISHGGLVALYSAGCPPARDEDQPRDPLRSTGRARNINLHQKSASETCSKAASWPYYILGSAARWGLKGWGVSDLIENGSFWGSGRPRAAQKPFNKVWGHSPLPF